MAKMNVLIDTNIIIPLEDAGRELDSRLAEVKRLSADQGIDLRIHPIQKIDIQRDRNENRKSIILSRLEQYNLVPNPPHWTETEAKEAGELATSTSENDYVDDVLLYTVQRDAVHLLLTEDRRIHRKAVRLGLQDRIYYIDSFLTFLRDQQKIQKHTPPLGIKSGFVHEFNVKNVFFDSLREGYPEFNNWFQKVARENRECWFVGTQDQIRALTIRKIEENETITKVGKNLPGRALKLCTFKVDLRGHKLGERLFYTAFQFAVQKSLDWVYLTLDGEAQKDLGTLCEDFGFKSLGENINGRDEVWCKNMRPPNDDSELSNIEYAIMYYPFYKKENCSKWLVPIQPKYHEMLFPDVSAKRNRFPEFRDDPNEYGSYANTIKKAYLCHANVKSIKVGDLIYFYRSQDRKSVQSVGIVDYCFRSSDSQEILAKIAKRTVYSQSEISDIAQKNTLVILFRLLEYITPPIDARTLLKNGINGPIQSIREIERALS